MEQIVQLNSNAKLSEHFTLGEMTKSSSHPEVYNIPSHEAIANLKRVCTWLEVLRKRYNERYNACHLDQAQRVERSLDYARDDRRGDGRDDKGGGTLGMTTAPVSSRLSEAHGEISEKPIIINSGYRSPQLNRKIGGVKNSNHLTGCAVDIRVTGMEQAKQYAEILREYADESHQDFDELLIEKNRYGAIWLHFAVRPRENRRRILYINA